MSSRKRKKRKKKEKRKNHPDFFFLPINYFPDFNQSFCELILISVKVFSLISLFFHINFFLTPFSKGVEEKNKIIKTIREAISIERPATPVKSFQAPVKHSASMYPHLQQQYGYTAQEMEAIISLFKKKKKFFFFILFFSEIVCDCNQFSQKGYSRCFAE